MEEKENAMNAEVCSMTSIMAAAVGLVVGLVAGFFAGRAGTGRRRLANKKFKELPPGAVEIYVGNLSYDTTEDFLRKEFEKFGAVTSVRIITNHFSHKSKGFGFIEMPNRPEAEKAIAALNESEIQGRKLHINEARNNKNCPPTPRPSAPGPARRPPRDMTSKTQQDTPSRGRESLASRLGFLLLSARCAIGLGNVWRFPFITGKYGGAVFLIAYLVFLALMGVPVLVMEFSVGRGSSLNMGEALRKLEPSGARWHCFGWMTIVGSYILMMFYIPVAGWMLSYMYKGVAGTLMAPAGTESVRDYIAALGKATLADPICLTAWTVVASAAGFGVCALGVRKGVERVTKTMMAGLLLIMVGLAAYSITLPGASEGLRFYLKPDFARAVEAGIWPLVNDAMNQAFFTLSVGIGTMCIFGSYLKRERTLTTESAIVAGLDTFVALTAGLVIFPACFAFNVDPDAGPALIFVTLPNVFNSMPRLAGHVFGALFFVFMSVAALTTVIAVVENCIAYFMDAYGWPRLKSTLANFVVLTLLTLPCVLGFNVWSSFRVPRIGGVLACEDFIVSNNLLPLGSLLFCLFCTRRHGWGWAYFTAEADAGRGMRFPQFLRFYLTWVLPALLVTVFIIGYWQKFGPQS